MVELGELPGVALMPEDLLGGVAGQRLMTAKVRNVTPHSTGMAVSSRRPTRRRAGELGRRRAPARPSLSRIAAPAPCPIET